MSGIFLILGWVGQKPVETPFIEVGMISTFFYFLFLTILIPLIGWLENVLLSGKENQLDKNYIN